jgi:hypothetical protein
MKEQTKPKIKKPRLKSVKSMMATVIEQLDQIAANPEMKIAKQADAVFSKAALLSSIYSTDSEERRLKIKHADIEKLSADLAQARAENERLRAEIGNAQALVVTPKTSMTFEERVAQL